MELDLVCGPDAERQLADPSFRAHWHALSIACPWGTVFQTPGFALPWYRVYAERFEPVVVVARRDGTPGLAGLLLLARDRSSGALVHVGAHHAEYQTWLAGPELGDAFVERALDVLAGPFAHATLTFLYLPPAAPRGWTDRAQGGRWAARAEVEPHGRGLIALGDGSEIRSTLNKSRYRYRLRKLDAMGGMRLERLTSAAALQPWLPAIMDYCDFRQGAVNGSEPFRADPLKLPLHLALADEPNVLHATVLSAGGQFVSAQLSWANRGQVALGLIAHATHFAKHSPGTLHLFLASRLAQEEGAATVDLTPSGEYKDRFASEFDTVCVVRIYLSWRLQAVAVTRRQVSDGVKAALRAARLDPRRVGGRVRHVARLVATSPAGALASAARRAVRWVAALDELRIYAYDLASRPLPPNPELMQRDDVHDLLARAPDPERSNRRTFLSQALERLEHDGRCYTRVEDGRLAHVGWLAEDEERAHLIEVGADFAPGPGTVTLYDFYTHPTARGRGLYAAALGQMLHDARAAGKARAYIAVMADNGASRRVIERVGFDYVGSFFQRVARGRVSRWANPASLVPPPLPQPAEGVAPTAPAAAPSGAHPGAAAAKDT